MATKHASQDPLPLTESTFFILASLAPAPKHGYAIWKDVEALSEGRVVLSTGTLYGALKRLLDQGWIRRFEKPQDEEASQPPHARKAYVLTGAGRRILAAEVRRLKTLVKAARRQSIEEQAA